MLSDFYFTQAASNGNRPQANCTSITEALASNALAEAPDSGRLGAGTQDGGRSDAGRSDAGRLDAGRSDAGRLDAGRLDAGRVDGGHSDAGISDAGQTTPSVSDGSAPSMPPPFVVGPLDPARPFVCNGYSDIEAAVIGLHPARAWLTRLEMNLPHEALSMDCRLESASPQTIVPNQIVAPKYSGDPCPGGKVQTAAASLTGFPWAIGSLAALGLSRRRRLRTSRS
jgi:hypothetical protein